MKVFRVLPLTFVLLLLPLVCSGYQDYLTNEITGLRIQGNDTKKAVILVHGWNPENARDKYEGVDSLYYLKNTLRLKLQATDWKLIPYHWEREAATGGVLDDVLHLQSVTDNATHAAENALLAGAHLTGILQSSAPDLRLVHFIAHSAGSWAVYEAARELLQTNPYVVVQITIVDPFIPGAVTSHSQDVGMMSNVRYFQGNDRLQRLENYFAKDTLFNDDGVTPGFNPFNFDSPTFGTQSTFNWRTGIDINQQVDWGIFPAPYHLWYDHHGGPTEFYADCVKASIPGETVEPGLYGLLCPFDYSQVGWFRSLYETVAALPRFNAHPQSTNVSPNSPVTLTVTAIRTDQFAWFKDGRLLTGITGSSYSFNASTAGKYTVRASNQNGVMFSDSATVSLTTPTVPIITSVSPSTLLPSFSPQLINIYGSNFKAAGDPNASMLIFRDPANIAYVRTPVFISSSQLQYNITVQSAVGNWSVTVTNAGQVASNLKTFLVQTPPPNTGSLVVNLSPAGAVSAGAQWRVDGGSYHNTGDVIVSLTPGPHTVAFKPVTGYATPADRTVSITSGATTTDTGAYIASIPTVATPSISPSGGNYSSPQPISLSCATSGATIRYSLSGLAPTTSSPVYIGPFTVNSSTTVKARAFKSGYNDSGVASATFTMSFGNTVETPVFSPNGGSFNQPVSVYIGDATSGATIFYSLDGSDPASGLSIQFTGDFTLNQSATVKARAYKDGFNSSQIISANFTVNNTQNNDSFANRISITGASNHFNGSNLQATKESGETNIFRSDQGDADNPGGKSVWWTWRAPYSGIVTFDTIGTHFDTLLGVYTGNSVSSLTFVAGDDDTALTLGADPASFATSKVTFQVAQGQDYAVVVDGYHSAFYNDIPNYTASGNIVLNWAMLTPPPMPDTVTDFRWTRKAGGGGGTANGFNRGYGVAADPSGNVFVTGYYASNAVFSTTILTNAGSDEAFLAKYDGAGSLLWANRIGGSGSDIGYSVATDSNGNCYAVGTFAGTASFGSSNLTALGAKDVFIAKYDPTGNCVWVTQAGGNSATPHRVVAKGTNIYVAGEFVGSFGLGGTTFNSAGQEDVFLAKFTSDGALLWTRQVGGNFSEQVGGLAVDDAGNAFITGWFTTYTLIVGGFTLQRTFSGASDFFLVKYDAIGNVVWAKREGGDGYDRGKAVALDAVGNIYVAGSFQATTIFGGQSLTSSGDYDVFIAKYGSAGNLVWIRQSGGTGSDEPYDIGLDGNGNIYVAGQFQGTANFQGTFISSAGSVDMFLSKHSSSGDLVVVKQGGGPAGDLAYAMTVDNAGNCFAAGQVANDATFGTTLLSAGPDSRVDIFVTRVGPPFFSPPTKPTNIAPANFLIGLAMPLAFQSSAFIDSNNGDTHAASEWLLRRADNAEVVLDSGTDTNNKTSLVIESNVATGITYSWRVRYQDSSGLWSDYSDPTTFTIGKLQQTIAFGPLSRQVFGDAPFALSASASSGLPVSFSVLSGPAVVSGNIVTLTGAGLVVLRASQSGNATNAPAPNVDQVVIVAPGNNVMTDFLRLSNGMFTFRFYGEPGTNYVVQGSTNLVNWSSLATNQVSGLGYLEFTDVSATNFNRRFFRIAP